MPVRGSTAMRVLVVDDQEDLAEAVAWGRRHGVPVLFNLSAVF